MGAGRPVLILALVLVLLVGVFGGGWYLAWRRVGPRILASPEYRVGPEQVEITTPLPDWIHSDIRAEVFRDPALDEPLSIMDDDLAKRIAKAFKRHPWVAKVGTVTKHHPALVKVPLVYRKPVCMVEAPGGPWPVDAEGVLLPSSDFSPLEASRYPRLVDVDRGPGGPPGRHWSDPKVIGGAEIAAALGPVWETLRLERIVPLATDAAAAGRAPEPIFVLLSRGGSRITWGYAPGANVLGEPAAAEKVARLQRYFDEHDSLDGPQGKPQELDLRTLGKGAAAMPSGITP